MFTRYGDTADAPAAPAQPDWCFEEEDESDKFDDDGNELAEGGAASTSSDAVSGSSNGSSGGRNNRKKKDGKFMEGVSGVTSVTQQPLLANIQKKIQRMCGWRSNGFPGSQPVSMGRDNLRLLHQMPYQVRRRLQDHRLLGLFFCHLFAF